MTPRTSSPKGLVGLVLIGLACQACTPDAADKVAAPAAPAAKGAVAAAAPAAPAPPNQIFVYTPVGKRDPFRSYLLEIEHQSAQAAGGRSKEPTELFEIDQYRLTAIITGTSQPKAMVEDPQGLGHVLHLGTRLGKNGGRVSRIISKEVTVMEETLDPAGRKMAVSIVKRLPRSDFEDAAKR
jgi:type IV pilus assembly protein PilP